MMSIIDDFISQYNKQFDFYQKLSQIISNKLEDELIKRGIKAIVNNRAKRPDSLKEKIIIRDKEKKYPTPQDIFNDIIDLAGIRVSLYFPTEREVVDEVVNDIFIVIKKKVFPDKQYMPKPEKRFSGYWANHYHVKIKEEASTKRYSDTIAEIQVASVLMHAWSEVEHDLVYKPFSGDLSREELAILDEINGLVLSGEIALERLQKAIAERTKKKNDITDKYELTNFLLSTLNKDYLNKIKIGDTFLLNNYLNTIKKLDVSDFNNYIKRINIDLGESVTDQLLNMLLVENDNEDFILKKYFKNLHISDPIATGFESFVRCWAILEKSMRQLVENVDSSANRYVISNFKMLTDKKIITSHDAKNLEILRRVRNELLHGIETPQEEYLKDSFYVLKAITIKVIDKVPSTDIKKELKLEFEKIK